jgi:hypothetical protein
VLTPENPGEIGVVTVVLMSMAAGTGVLVWANAGIESVLRRAMCGK